MPIRGISCLPPLAKLDDDSDSDCDSLTDLGLPDYQEPVIEAEGEVVVERDLWKDHPIQQ